MHSSFMNPRIKQVAILETLWISSKLSSFAIPLKCQNDVTVILDIEKSLTA